MIHEAALRIRVGGPKTAQEQLRHLLNLSETPHLNVRVAPFNHDKFARAGYSMLYVQGATPRLDTVHIDTGHGGVFVDAEPRLKQYQRRYGPVESSALNPAESRDLISRIIHEL